MVEVHKEHSKTVSETTQRILLVDDEPDVGMLIRHRFRRQIRDGRIDFLFAVDGVAALQMLDAHPEVDIVITDINMPGMDGLALLSALKHLERPLKVIIVSAYGDMGNIRTAMHRGAFDFLIKPIDFVDLEITLERTREELVALREARASRERLRMVARELDIAGRIQLALLPEGDYLARDDLDLHAFMLPAKEVGGDFYDFFAVDDHRIGFAIGDVSGKGIGAAMFMAVVRTMLRSTALQGLSPAACVAHMNRVLYPENVAHMFVTLFYGILDTKEGRVTYCNAGHNPPLVLRREGALTPVAQRQGPAVCLVPDYAYGEAHLQLDDGEGIFLYTDGVTEAFNRAHEEFSEARLGDTLRHGGTRHAARLIEDVFNAVRAFAEGAPQADDITMLAVRYRGA